MLVTRVEQHQINSSHYLYDYCNDLCFKSKNLYNYANYLVRQEFINDADVNSAYQIIKKVSPNAFNKSYGVEAVVLQPSKISIS